jgi:fatty-acyl-CoA synthase
MYKLAEELATGLVSKFQLKPKDRIGIYAYNKYEWVVVQLAAAMADLILVNINPAYQSDELAYTIEKVGLSVLFLNDKFKHLNYIDIVRSIVPELETNSPFDLQSKRFPTLKGVVRMNTQNDTVKGFVNYSDIPEPSKRSLFKDKIHHEDPANIQFTSGTTGRPKAATLSHYNILNNAYLIGDKCRYTTADNIAVAVPFYHCFGMILGTLGAYTRGAGISVITEGFDPKMTLETISKYKCTSLYGVPTMFIEYLRHYEEDPKKYSI